eukprot:SAG22_NODE_11989_length_460_cov_24.240997_2_plen_48_part_01
MCSGRWAALVGSWGGQQSGCEAVIARVSDLSLLLRGADRAKKSIGTLF